jgi:hypothetical protein
VGPASSEPPIGTSGQRWWATAESVLRRVARTVSRIAVVGVLAGAVVWWALFRALESSDDRAAWLAVAAILLLVPPGLLVVFVVGVRALIALPHRLREAPNELRDRAVEVRRRARDVGEARRRGLLRTAPAVFRLWRAVASSREVMEIVAPAVLLSPWTLVAASLAVPAVVLEALLAVVAAIWLAAR